MNSGVELITIFEKINLNFDKVNKNVAELKRSIPIVSL